MAATCTDACNADMVQKNLRRDVALPSRDNVFLLVYLIKRPRVGEAAIPNLIHHLRSFDIVLTTWPIRNRCCSSPLHAFLMPIGEFSLASPPEFIPKLALAAQR